MEKEGTLYVVATPIGNLGDMSPRAIEVLSDVDLIAAEDTRRSRPLLAHFGISTPLLALHEHNERALVDDLLQRMQAGTRLALISDAGTPLISDPGFLLVREAQARGLRVSPIPGPSAAVAALSAAGLPSDRFVFEGFLSRSPGARRERLRELQEEQRTLIFYVSNHRLRETLADLREILGGRRQVAFAREITKLHETLLRLSLAALCERVDADPLQSKGEIVLLVQGAEDSDSGKLAEAQRVLRILLDELPVKKAVLLAAKITGVKRNQLYQKALEWRRQDR